MGRAPTNTRQEILDAANRVVTRNGVNHLTLEAVAREANVSKGGLLYHFHSKNELIEGMLENIINLFEESFNTAAMEETENSPGRWTRAYVKASMAASIGADQTFAGLITAISTAPMLLERFREHFKPWQDLIENDGLDPILATIIRYSADGIYFTELFGLAAPNESLRNRLADALIKLTFPGE